MKINILINLASVTNYVMDFSVISFLLKAKLSYLIFHPLEFVSHYRNPQLQVDEKSTFSNLDILALFSFPYFDLLIKQPKFQLETG